MNLFINACVRSSSRTEELARVYLERLEGETEEVRLKDHPFPVVNEDYLNKRDSLIKKEQWSDPMFSLANQFARADRIIIAAPYWDLSFPASLKQYIELVNVVGLTFTYNAQGQPEGLCRADSIDYFTTAGGLNCPDDYGYEYIKALAERYYGIAHTQCIHVEGLDIVGNDARQIMEQALDQVKAIKISKESL